MTSSSVIRDERERAAMAETVREKQTERDFEQSCAYNLPMTTGARHNSLHYNTNCTQFMVDIRQNERKQIIH
jgi:hypothetical protein